MREAQMGMLVCMGAVVLTCRLDLLEHHESHVKHDGEERHGRAESSATLKQSPIQDPPNPILMVMTFLILAFVKRKIEGRGGVRTLQDRHRHSHRRPDQGQHEQRRGSYFRRGCRREAESRGPRHGSVEGDVQRGCEQEDEDPGKRDQG